MITLGRVVVFLVAVLAVRGKKSAYTQTFLGSLARRAHENELPHQVSIQIDGNHVCGGSLIGKQHVLTAAHCVHPMIVSPETPFVKGERMTVEVGSIRLKHGIEHRVKRISEIATYPGWFRPANGSFPHEDIAVITLRTPVNDKLRGVSIIRLPDPMHEIAAKEVVKLSGFGSRDDEGPVSEFLLTSRMKIVSDQQCNETYIKVYGTHILPSHICAKQKKGYGPCEGDNGGPLVHKNTLIGVVSGGMAECAKGYPDIYTKVSHFIPYIMYEMNYPNVSNHSMARAVDIPEPPADALPPWDNPEQYDIQWMNYRDLTVYPPGSIEVKVNPYTGMFYWPYTPNPPYEPLHPLYIESSTSDS